jgi:hypothetical protein
MRPHLQIAKIFDPNRCERKALGKGINAILYITLSPNPGKNWGVAAGKYSVKTPYN